MGMLEPPGGLRAHPHRAGRRKPGSRDGDDRRDPFDGPSHGVKPAGQKGGKRFIGRTKGGLNSKLHTVADAKGRPNGMYLSAGQTRDDIDARALLSSLPKPGALLANRGYDAG